MTLTLLGVGTGLIFVGLWNRDDEVTALSLFAIGALLVLAAAIYAMVGFEPSQAV